MRLDKKHKKLKADVNACYDAIELANTSLRKIREVLCDHPKIDVGTHSPRPGQYFENTEICAVCGKVLNIPGIPLMKKIKSIV